MGKLHEILTKLTSIFESFEIAFAKSHQSLSKDLDLCKTIMHTLGIDLLMTWDQTGT